MQSTLNITDMNENEQSDYINDLDLRNFLLYYSWFFVAIRSRSVVARSFVHANYKAFLQLWPWSISGHRHACITQSRLKNKNQPAEWRRCLTWASKGYKRRRSLQSSRSESYCAISSRAYGQLMASHYCRHYQGHVQPTHNTELNVTKIPKISLNYYYRKSGKATNIIITPAELLSVLALFCGVGVSKVWLPAAVEM